MYQCFHCGQNTVTWDADFPFEDYCKEGEGIIHECHCTNCGAQITYRISLEETIKPDYFVAKIEFEDETSVTSERHSRFEECVTDLINMINNNGYKNVVNAYISKNDRLRMVR